MVINGSSKDDRSDSKIKILLRSYIVSLQRNS
jgi:hypothetical protein